MYKITKEFTWDMAHRLPTHGGKCFNVHGHTYKALITLEGIKLIPKGQETGMLKDFGNLKFVKEWIDKNWDHAYVGHKNDEVIKFLKKNKFKVFEMNNNPTAENMSRLLFEVIKENIQGVKLSKVVIYENPNNSAEYYE